MYFPRKERKELRKERKGHLQKLNEYTTHNGFYYIYTSNASSARVDWDNLKVTHYKSTLQAEFHYYPFGLSINLAQAFGAKPQPQLFTNQTFERNEFTQGKGLNLYDFEARTYDSQIGRWWQMDPLAEQYYNHSPYIYVGNNPISYVDPDGRSLDDYKLKQDGNLELIALKPEDKNDKIFATDKADRPIEDKSTEVDKSFIKSAKTVKDGEGNKFTYYELNDDKSAGNIFKFFSDNTNNKEWSHIALGVNKNYISSTGNGHNNGSGVKLVDYLLSNDFHVRSHTHSHPTSLRGPSGLDPSHKQIGDRLFVEYIYNQYPK